MEHKTALGSKMIPIFLTYAEMAIVEEALYARASVLYAIADQQIKRENNSGALQLDYKATALEKVAGKIGYPLDKQYMDSYKETKTIKESN